MVNGVEISRAPDKPFPLPIQLVCKVTAFAKPHCMACAFSIWHLGTARTTAGAYLMISGYEPTGGIETSCLQPCYRQCSPLLTCGGPQVQPHLQVSSWFTSTSPQATGWLEVLPHMPSIPKPKSAIACAHLDVDNPKGERRCKSEVGACDIFPPTADTVHGLNFNWKRVLQLRLAKFGNVPCSLMD